MERQRNHRRIRNRLGMGDLDVKKNEGIQSFQNWNPGNHPQMFKVCVYLWSEPKGFDMNVRQGLRFFEVFLFLTFRFFPSLIPNCFSSWIPVDEWFFGVSRPWKSVAGIEMI